MRPEFWGHDESDSDSADFRDYVLGCIEGVASNLQSLAYHHAAHRGMRYAQDADMKKFMEQFGTPYPKHGNRRFAERHREVEVHFDGVVQSLASALDCAAGAFVGIAGLQTQIQRADLSSLVKVSLATGEDAFTDGAHRALRKTQSDKMRATQVNALLGIAQSLRAAGPDGWLDWALGIRNMVVHRERRLSFIVQDKRQFRWLSPQNPHASNMQAIRSSQGDLESYYIHEDNLDVADGLARSTAASIVGMAAVLSSALSQRADLGREGHVELEAQWKSQRPAPSFEGYGHARVSIPRNAGIHINPADAERLIQAGLLRR